MRCAGSGVSLPGVRSYGVLRALMLAALLVAGVASPPGQVDEGVARTGEQPNIVFILTDDLDTGSVSVMPELRSQLIEQGTTFNNAFATDPLCCPSRATFLRGQYSHNTGIVGNSPPDGGHGRFRNLNLDRSTVATWLQDAGYHTFYAGKYMNGYGSGDTYVPPGWDRWYGWQGRYRSPGGEYRLNENGDIKRYDLDRIHDTDLLREKTVDFIRNQRGAGAPFFAYVAPNAPHTPAYVPERHEGMFSERSLPRPPSFDEEDVSDKPAAMRKARLDHEQIKELGDRYRKRLASLQSVDGMVAAILAVLRDTDQLDDTYVIFASDNGFLLGEHRRVDKSVPYEESIRIPFIVRGPQVPARRVNHLVTNNDFAPTVAQLAGVNPSKYDFVDGKSFVPLLRPGEPPPEQWRTGFLVEHVTPTYQALRTKDYTYVEWPGGEKELYALEGDPYQLHNLLKSDLPNPPPDTTALAAQLGALKDCKADKCRAAEVR